MITKWALAHPNPPRPIVCAWCGETVVRKVRTHRDAGMCCSRRCGFAYRDAKRAKRKAEREQQERCDRLTKRQSRQAESERKRRQARLEAACTIAQRTCRVCGRPFTKPLFVPGIHNLCSDECRERAKRDTRRIQRCKYGHKPRDRARKMGRSFERCGPIEVCTRDNWRCQLCGIVTPRRLRGTYDSRAPEVDHIIPLADPRSPGHVWSNVQCLCRACNAAKSARIRGQLRLDLGGAPSFVEGNVPA